MIYFTMLLVKGITEFKYCDGNDSCLISCYGNSYIVTVTYTKYMERIVRLKQVKCPKCGNKFETYKSKDIQCGKIMDDGKRCGKRFDP